MKRARRGGVPTDRTAVRLRPRHAWLFFAAVLAAVALLGPAASVAAPGATFHVNSTADTTGCTTTTCTLRGAITAANAAAGRDRIVFDLASGSVIKPGSALPAVAEGVTIDGTGNSCAGGSPAIVLNGSKLSGSASLLTASVGGVTICGLVVQAAPGSGIVLTSKGGDTLLDNYIGTDITGTTAVPNGVTKSGLATGGAGITISSPNNVVGGTTSTARNLISGNITGLRIAGATATGNQVLGNYIGTNAAGAALLGNGQDVAVWVLSAANTIGGTTGNTPGTACSGACNLIAGGRSWGLLIDGGSASGNQVLGNFIGTNAAGSTKITNSGAGVELRNAPNNIVGNANAAGRNLISGNAVGVSIENVAGITGNATGNRVLGNYIGTTASGTAALGNSNFGVSIRLAGSNTVGGIDAGNVISGNGFDAVRITGAAASGNQVLGNYLGVDATGSARLANALEGVRLASAPNNTIGGTAAGAGNVISGNSDVGIFIYDDPNVAGSSTGNQLLGNRIGTNAAGTAAISNSFGGIFLRGAGSSTIGGSAPGARNLISGNVRNGITIVSGSTANQVLGNFIGTNATGGGDIGNTWAGVSIQSSGNNVVGVVGAGNVISGNDVDGVQVVGGASGNRLVANTIGLDGTGTVALGNTLEGVRLAGAPNNVVGGTASGAGNVVSGNGDAGLFIYNDPNIAGSSTGNQLLGNLIGTNAAGTSAVGNTTSGVYVSNAGPDVIGGSAAGARNVISGNGTQGITLVNGNAPGSQVLGNFIGTDVSGSLRIANAGDGVFVLGPNNTIGGSTGTTPGGSCTGACNVISGNGIRSVEISGTSASGNQILGNFIGVTAAGGAKVPGVSEGVLIAGASGNTVGGTTTAARNVISGSSADGVLIFNNANGNQVTGNYIGTSSDGSAPVGNFGSGVRVISASSNVVGGTTGTTPGGACTGACNLISGNSRGVSIESSSSTGNRVSANSIVDNAQLGIDLGGDGVTPNGSGPTGPNAFQNHPVLASATSASGTTTIVGTLPGSAGTFHVELFDSPSCDATGSGEGKTFLGSLDGISPNVQFSLPSPSSAAPPGHVVTATATDGSGNTSEFSQCVPVKTQPTISTTLSQTSVAPGGEVHDSASLSGATSDAGGTVTYTVYSDSACTQNPQGAGAKTVTNGTVPDSDALTFNSSGTFYWQAVYSGDGKNNGATSSCASEQLTVTSATAVNGQLAFDGSVDGSFTNFEVFAINPDGSCLRRVTTNPGFDFYPAWSPDGTKIAFMSEKGGNRDIWVMNADGTGQEQLTTSPAQDYFPAWSPNGSKIVFVSQRDGNDEIYVMNSDGTAQTRLTTSPSTDDSPSWSPDGTRIAFRSERTGSGDIYLMNPDGTNLFNVTNDSDAEVYTSWSPDGTKIAFVANGAVSSINVDGTGRTALASGSHPAWSPDGNRIAFANGGQIWTMNADGSAKSAISTPSVFGAGDPSWQPLPPGSTLPAC